MWRSPGHQGFSCLLQRPLLHRKTLIQLLIYCPPSLFLPWCVPLFVCFSIIYPFFLHHPHLSFLSSLFSTGLYSHRPGSVGPVTAAQAAVEQRSGYVPSGGCHHQVRRQTGGHGGAGEVQTAGERNQEERGGRTSRKGVKSSQASSAFSIWLAFSFI